MKIAQIARSASRRRRVLMAGPSASSPTSRKNWWRSATRRLPELYCGFGRRPGEPPVGYPVACLPQAWSSGAAFLLLQACLGIRIDSGTRTVHVDLPELPVELERLPVRGLAVADERVDLVLERVGERVTATPLGPVPDSIHITMRA